MDVFLGTKEKDGSTASLLGADRRKHCAIFGKSGVGKTTLMRNMIVADIFGGNGVTVIDPHGSLVDDILQSIPKSRTNDVVYFDPADPERIIGLNVLESVDRNHRSLVVSSLISILRNLYPHNWGPRTEYVLEHAVYALLEQKEPVTLAALPKLLVDENYRRKVVKNVTDPAIRSFFQFYELQNDRFVRLEPQVTLGGEAQVVTHGCDFRETNGTECRVAPAEAIKTESDISIVWIYFRQKPRTARTRSKELHDRLEVDFILSSAYRSLLAAVFQKARLNIWGEKCHMIGLDVGGAPWR
jgi:hypothetical protein